MRLLPVAKGRRSTGGSEKIRTGPEAPRPEFIDFEVKGCPRWWIYLKRYIAVPLDQDLRDEGN